MNDPDAAKSRDAETSRCSELGALFLERLESSSPSARGLELGPELARHRAECESCAAEWAELLEFEDRFATHLTDPGSIPAEVRAAYVGAQRRAHSLHEHSFEQRTADQRTADHRSGFADAAPSHAGSGSGRAALERAPAARGVSRFAAAIVLSLTVGLLATFLGSGTERPVDGRLSLIRIERSGEGTLAPGEPFRLRASAVRDGYLTIVVSDGESIDLLFPHPDPSSEEGFSTLGAPGAAIAAGESWEIPNPSYGEFTASESPGRETYFLFVRPLSGGHSADSIESTLRAQFDASLAAEESLDRFERWLTGRYASVDRVELTVE